MSTTFVLFGLPINGLIAVGRAHLVRHATLEVLHYTINQELVGQEQERLISAQALLSQELTTTWRQAQKDQPPEIAAIIEVQQLILHDPQLVSTALTRIAVELCNAEWALLLSMESLVAQFKNMDNAYLAERQHDIRQLTEQLLHHMQGQSSLIQAQPHGNEIEPRILVARDLSPAELMTLRSSFQQEDGGWMGFVTEMGGENAHTSILARSQEMPAIVAVPHSFRIIQQHEWVILDGELGAVIVNPDEFTLAEYHSKAATLNARRLHLQRLAKVPTQTLDDIRVKLMANVNSLDDVRMANKYGAEGIGLFRSEFLYMSKKNLPDEDTQFISYQQALLAMPKKVVTIRTLDIGGDKLLNIPEMQERLAQQAHESRNEQLGLRAIRLCLAYPDLFRTQLRALLRASVFGELRLLLPMITAEFELNNTLELIESCKAELRHEGKEFREDIPIGLMVEVPAMMAIIPHLAKKIQFLSLGTNDLIQYALAVDRGSVSVGYLYNPIHPGIMALLHQAFSFAKKWNLPIAVCGELGGDIQWTRVLLGMGLREFSMTPSQLLSVKQTLLMSDHTSIIRKMKRWRSMNQEALNKLFHNINHGES